MWIASSLSGMVQKYSHDGSKLLLQIGKKGVFDSSDGTEKGQPLNSNAAQFFMPASIFVDPPNDDVYVADGEGSGGNRRIAVMDRNGKFLRQWQPEGMRTVHCMIVSTDGLVYVCNRQASRIQVYDKLGNFKKNIETPWTPYTAPPDGNPKESGGAAVALDLSRDSKQRYLYLLNQNNEQIEVWTASPVRSSRLSVTPGILPANSTRLTASRWTPRATFTSPKTAAAGFRSSSWCANKPRRPVCPQFIEESGHSQSLPAHAYRGTACGAFERYPAKIPGGHRNPYPSRGHNRLSSKQGSSPRSFPG